MGHRSETWRAGFAVRRDWPDGGHEFVRFVPTEGEAARFIDADHTYWRRGPWRPGHAIVVISQRDFDLHRARPGCRAPDCPTASSSVSHARHT